MNTISESVLEGWMRFVSAKVLVTALVLFFAQGAFAQDDGISFNIHHQYQSPRALAMGDAFVAVANDYSAIFYNPAALARRTDGQVNLSLDVALSAEFQSFAKQLQNAQNNGGATSEDKQTAIINVINENYGKTFALRTAPMAGVWVRPNWGIAFIPADVSIQMDLHNQVGPAIDTTVYADTTLAYAYAKDFDWIPNSRFSMGITGKFVNRAFVSKAVSVWEAAENTNLVQNSDLQEGYTVDADIGTMWTPNIPSDGLLSWFSLARPTFAAVVRNVAQTGFGHSLHLINKETTAPPEPLYRVLDLGSRWEYPSFWIFGGRGTLDIRDIGHPLFDARKGLHAGLEFDWAVTNWWKGHYDVGINEGYWTAGLGAEFALFNLDLVSYGEDVGPMDYPSENRMYMARLNLDF